MPGRHLAARQLPRTPAQPTSVSGSLISRDPGAGLPQAALSHTPKNRKVYAHTLWIFRNRGLYRMHVKSGHSATCPEI